MPMQKDDQVPAFQVLADDGVALVELLCNGRRASTFELRLRQVPQPVPRLNWPADLFRDGLAH